MISFDSQIKVIKSHGFKNISTILKYSHVHLDLSIFCVLLNAEDVFTRCSSSNTFSSAKQTWQLEVTHFCLLVSPETVK